MVSRIKAAVKKSRLLTKTCVEVRKALLTVVWNVRLLSDRVLMRDEIYGCCFVFTTLFGRIKKNNWGDDLNEHLFKRMSGMDITFVPFDQLLFSPNVERYSLIGSIIGDFNLDNTIIYGSGAITSDPKLIGTPKKVLSVRGPLTREVLLKNGIDCPAVFGDPALLLPLVYKPKIARKYKIGVIPHYRTEGSGFIDLLKNNQDVLLIDMSGYKKWTDIVDSVLSCEVIISESLHGIIVAEAYGIPSVWAEFIPHHYSWEWDFKYQDFYRSIGKYDAVCHKVYEGADIESMLQSTMEWKPGKVDYDSMIKAFPFAIKGDFKDE